MKVKITNNRKVGVQLKTLTAGYYISVPAGDYKEVDKEYIHKTSWFAINAAPDIDVEEIVPPKKTAAPKTEKKQSEKKQAEKKTAKQPKANKAPKATKSEAKTETKSEATAEGVSMVAKEEAFNGTETVTI